MFHGCINDFDQLDGLDWLDSITFVIDKVGFEGTPLIGLSKRQKTMSSEWGRGSPLCHR